jgi:hypothetical protein
VENVVQLEAQLLEGKGFLSVYYMFFTLKKGVPISILHVFFTLERDGYGIVDSKNSNI